MVKTMGVKVPISRSFNRRFLIQPIYLGSEFGSCQATCKAGIFEKQI